MEAHLQLEPRVARGKVRYIDNGSVSEGLEELSQHLDLMVLEGGLPQQSQEWEEARHAACSRLDDPDVPTQCDPRYHGAEQRRGAVAGAALNSVRQSCCRLLVATRQRPEPAQPPGLCRLLGNSRCQPRSTEALVHSLARLTVGAKENLLITDRDRIRWQRQDDGRRGADVSIYIRLKCREGTRLEDLNQVRLSCACTYASPPQLWVANTRVNTATNAASEPRRSNSGHVEEGGTNVHEGGRLLCACTHTVTHTGRAAPSAGSASVPAPAEGRFSLRRWRTCT